MGLTQKLGTIPLAILTDASNNVGIGAAPSGSYKLEVTGTGRFTGALTGTSATFSGNVGINGASASTPLLVKVDTNLQFRVDTYLSTTNLASINGSASAYAAMRIDGSTLYLNSQSGGNVGIGTSSPATTLEVLSPNNNAVNITTSNATTLYTTYRYNTSTVVGFIGNGVGVASGGAVGDFGFQAINNMVFTTGSLGTERMRIAANGKISTSNAPSGDWGMTISNTNSASNSFGLSIAAGANASDVSLNVIDKTATYVYFRIRGDGYIFSPPTYNNQWAGYSANMYVASDGSFGRTTPSSVRYKDNIQDWNGKGLQTILALKPKTFNYKKDYCETANINFLGLIAEEVAEVLPYLAQYENPDRTGLVENVRYDTIVVPLIAAIQELKQEKDIDISTLQAQIEELKTKLNNVI